VHLLPGLEELYEEELAGAQRHDVGHHEGPFRWLREVLPRADEPRGTGGLIADAVLVRSTAHRCLSRDEKPNQRPGSGKYSARPLNGSFQSTAWLHAPLVVSKE
jgi:hypothetical protein